MKNLVGRSFSLAGNEYRIVDVQRPGRDALVYAELIKTVGCAAGGVDGAGRLPDRTAFHYGDIVALLECAER